MSKNGTTNYVDKAHFYQLMVERKAKIAECEAEGKPVPPVSDAIGKIILDIATNLSYRYNFINYTFREEMIGDGIVSCITYLDNFDPAKSKNPFGFFTQICYYAFVQRINKEGKQADIRGKVGEEMIIGDEFYDTQDHDGGENYFTIEE